MVLAPMLPQFGTFRVRVQALELGKFPNDGNRFHQRSAIILHHTGAALKLIYCQTRKGPPGSAGWQGVAGTCDIIAQYCGRPRTQQDRAGSEDSFRELPCAASHYLALLRSKL